MEKKYVPMSIREVQLASLNILKKVHEICDKLNITYYLMYGSLLGAVRHKGFIPWDDDLDISMKMEDYKKLIEYFNVHKEELLPFELHNYSNNKKCFYNISRICDNRYHLEFSGFDYTSGAFIDVYPLEGLGSDEDLEKWKSKLKLNAKLQKKCVMSKYKGLLFGSSPITKFLNLPQMIVCKCLGTSYYIKKFNMYEANKWEESKWIGVLSWETKYYERKWFDSVVKIKFEDMEAYVPIEYEEYLKKNYGDYMKLPPKEKRVPQHGYKAYKIIE